MDAAAVLPQCVQYVKYKEYLETRNQLERWLHDNPRLQPAPTTPVKRSHPSEPDEDEDPNDDNGGPSAGGQGGASGGAGGGDEGGGGESADKEPSQGDTTSYEQQAPGCSGGRVHLNRSVTP